MIPKMSLLSSMPHGVVTARVLHRRMRRWLVFSSWMKELLLLTLTLTNTRIWLRNGVLDQRPAQHPQLPPWRPLRYVICSVDPSGDAFLADCLLIVPQNLWSRVLSRKCFS